MKNFQIKNQFKISLLSSAILMITSCETDDIQLPAASTVVATLSATPKIIAENNGSSSIKVSLNNYAFSPVNVKLEFSGTATEGEDYTISSDDVTIPVGQKEGIINIKAISDALFEDNESVVVKIASITNAVSDNNNETITIKEGLSANPLIINEVLYDPSNSGLKGDANGDGVYNQDQDEFIELVNNSTEPLDISDYKIYDATALANNTPRHIFPKGTVVPAGKAIVVFGGGTPKGAFGNSIVQTASGMGKE